METGEQEDKFYEERVKILNYILKISKQYSYLWDDSEILNEGNLEIFSAFLDQDESCSIYVQEYKGRFSFKGKNLCNYLNINKKQLSAKEVSKGIENWGFDRPITPGDLMNSFCSSLEKPLGKYLAKKELRKLKNDRRNC